MDHSTSDIADMIQELTSRNAELKRMDQAIGTKKDTREFRSKLIDTRTFSKELSQQILDALRRFSGKAMPAERRVLSKLRSQFETEVAKFRDIVKSIENKERQVLVAVSHSAGQSSPLASMQDDDVEYGVQRDRLSSMEHVKVDQYIDDIDAIERQHEEILHTAQDVQELNEMFKSLAFLVEEQQEDIDIIENSVKTTKSHVDTGLVSLQKAEKDQKKTRKCKCYLMIVLVILLFLIIFLPTYFSINKK